MKTVIVHFDKDGNEIASTSLVEGALEALRHGLKGAAHDAYVRAVRTGDEKAAAALAGETKPKAVKDVVAALCARLAVAGAVRHELREIG